jgi:hypothetical protein
MKETLYCSVVRGKRTKKWIDEKTRVWNFASLLLGIDIDVTNFGEPYNVIGIGVITS